MVKTSSIISGVAMTLACGVLPVFAGDQVQTGNAATKVEIASQGDTQIANAGQENSGPFMPEIPSENKDAINSALGADKKSRRSLRSAPNGSVTIDALKDIQAAVRGTNRFVSAVKTQRIIRRFLAHLRFGPKAKATAETRALVNSILSRVSDTSEDEALEVSPEEFASALELLKRTQGQHTKTQKVLDEREDWATVRGPANKQLVKAFVDAADWVSLPVSKQDLARVMADAEFASSLGEGGKNLVRARLAVLEWNGEGPLPSVEGLSADTIGTAWRIAAKFDGDRLQPAAFVRYLTSVVAGYADSSSPLGRWTTEQVKAHQKQVEDLLASNWSDSMTAMVQAQSLVRDLLKRSLAHWKGVDTQKAYLNKYAWEVKNWPYLVSFGRPYLADACDELFAETPKLSKPRPQKFTDFIKYFKHETL